LGEVNRLNQLDAQITADSVCRARQGLQRHQASVFQRDRAGLFEDAFLFQRADILVAFFIS
jgi:hypothetical protein